ncbi:MAG: hypothetical protein JWR84_4237 [Caulobacter sp.]|nr:hypothetical protein [Caulobacter sp.]
MSEAVAGLGLIRRLTGGVDTIAVFLVGAAAFGYLTSGRGRLEFTVLPGNLWATVTAVAGFLLILLLLSTRLIDRLPWQGVLPLPAARGYSWTRSGLSRLLIVLFSASWLWWWTALVGMGAQAYYQGDWGRLAVVVGLGLLSGLPAVGILWLSLNRKPLLTLDEDGLFERRLGRLAWSEIEKIGVGRDPAARQVQLFLNTGPALSPARTLALNEVGLTSARFVACVEEVAPQVVIERPTPPPQPFGR